MSTTLNEMAQLARALLDAEINIQATEETLKLVKKRAMRLREETIPSAMQELGLQKLQLDTGQTITIKQEVYASIPEENKTKAFGWLEKNNFGGLIKSVIKIEFGRDRLDEASYLCDRLQDQGHSPEFTESVHASTLKAFLREQVIKGTPIPLDLFGARPVWVAKIK